MASPNNYKVNKKYLKKLLYILIVLVVSAIVSGFIDVDSTEKTVDTPAQPGFYRVVGVGDGDTITVNMDGRDEKIRFIGVDTPETIKPNSPVECYGKEASDYLKNLLTNKTVKLEADPINQNRDRYQRLLRYVYTQNNQLVNKQIIAQGYGFAYLSFPFTKSEEFRLTQIKARQNGVGVWGSDCQIKSPTGERPKTNELI